MDWFDESDEEEEVKQPQHQQNDEEEEEDPLDAYMKSLGDTATSSSSSFSVPSQPRAERLNILNEDEATDHWKEVDIQSDKKQKEQHDVDDDDGTTAAADTTDFFGVKTQAQQAMASTFHRAGSKKKTHAEYQDDDDDDVFIAQHASRRHHHSQEDNLKLQAVQHDQEHYEEFQKVFWTPQNTERGHSWRKQHNVYCHPANIDPIYEFTDLQSILGESLYTTITKRYKTPTLVQAQTLPVALAGHDALITASTGSGKTLAYVWPMIVHVCDQRCLEVGEETGPIGLILVPTRELATQVHQHVQVMLKTQQGGKAVVITGGSSKYHLVQELKRGGCDIVTATPGRFLDVLNVSKKGGMSLKRVTCIVLDEADKMLEMNFESQVTEILKNIRPDRQSFMTSATLSRKVEVVARKWLNSDNTIRIAVGRTGEASTHVQQHVMVLPSIEAKQQWMMEMLPVLANVGKTLVFVATRNDCELLAERIRSPSLLVETLHGDKHQTDRTAALKAFSKGKLGALIATDVAARGLDVKDVSTVVNYDPAKSVDAHVHRVGRAGRLSTQQQEHQKGVAYTLLLTPKNADFAHVLVSAFEREGREVTTELRELANKSRRSGNVAARTKWNKSGLGFHQADPSHMDTPNGGGEGSHYGPSSSSTLSDEPPPPKRSRWG